MSNERLILTAANQTNKFAEVEACDVSRSMLAGVAV